MKQIQVNTIVVSSVILLWLLFRKGEAAAAEVSEAEQALVVMEERVAGEPMLPSTMPTIPADREVVVEEVVLEPEYAEDRIFIQYPGLDIWIPKKIGGDQ
jgi:hypothetical protein